MIKEQWGLKMVDFYLSLYFFSFFKQRGILGYAIQTSIIVFKGMVKKEIKKKIEKVTIQAQSILHAFRLTVVLSTFSSLTS